MAPVAARHSAQGVRLSGGDDPERAVLGTRARIGMCEVRALALLCARGAGEAWPRAALECALAGNPLDVSDALSNLAADGVICLSEQCVMLSRTALMVVHGATRIVPTRGP